MPNAFAERLRGRGQLSDDDVRVLSSACQNVRSLEVGRHLIREGDKPDAVFVMLQGWACRYKVLPDGSRQIIAFMLPGDFDDVHIAVLEAMDHSVATLTKARVAWIPHAQMEALAQTSLTIARALRWSQLVDQGVLRAWIISIGRRKSSVRIAHLMCELYIRMRNIGLATDDQCELPLTQIVIADALGLTPVHVNRVLRQLREDQVMDLRSGTLTIMDAAKLARIAGFDGSYLHGRQQLVA